MKAIVTTQTVEKVVTETEEVFNLTMNRREAELIRSVLYLAEFNCSGQQNNPQLQSIEDLSHIRVRLGSALGWSDPMFVVDTNQRHLQETVYIKPR